MRSWVTVANKKTAQNFRLDDRNMSLSVMICHDVMFLLQENFVDQELPDLDLLHMYGQSKQERREHLSQRVRKTRPDPFFREDSCV